MSQINVNEFSEQLNVKADLDLRNIDTSRADMVIEYQKPTSANGYKWYRLYATGWVEQGGWFTGTSSATAKAITLPVAMTDNNYSGYAICQCSTATDTGNSQSYRTCFIKTSATQITVSQTNTWKTQWTVFGMADMTGHEILPQVAETQEYEHRCVTYQEPTSNNNYTWFRKYADGWVEQGGVMLTYSTGGWQSGTTVNLPVAMADNKYAVTWMNGWNGYTGEATATNSKATTYFIISQFTSYSSSNTASWTVFGKYAS